MTNVKRKKPPRVTEAHKAKLDAACKLLNELAADGFELYLAGWSLFLLKGPSHDPKTGKSQANNIVHQHDVHMDGGDW